MDELVVERGARIPVEFGRVEAVGDLVTADRAQRVLEVLTLMARRIFSLRLAAPLCTILPE